MFLSIVPCSAAQCSAVQYTSAAHCSQCSLVLRTGATALSCVSCAAWPGSTQVGSAGSATKSGRFPPRLTGPPSPRCRSHPDCQSLGISWPLVIGLVVVAEPGLRQPRRPIGQVPLLAAGDETHDCLLSGQAVSVSVSLVLSRPLSSSSSPSSSRYQAAGQSGRRPDSETPESLSPRGKGTRGFGHIQS